jgi:MFS family permease
MGTNVTWSATTLTIIVVARRAGASGSEIGVMLAIVGIGGVAGTAISGFLLRRLSAPAVVLGSVWCWAALISCLLLTSDPFLLGAILGLALSLAPAWNGVAVGLRIRLTPDHLQGRLHAVEALLSFGGRPFAVLAVGFLLDGIGGHATIAAVAAWTLAIAILSTLSPSLRRPPELAAASSAHPRLTNEPARRRSNPPPINSEPDGRPTVRPIRVTLTTGSRSGIPPDAWTEAGSASSTNESS